MKKLILIIAIVFSGMLMQAQNSVILKSYQKVKWVGTQNAGTDSSVQEIVFTSSSISMENTLAQIKSKSKWGSLMGDQYITLYDNNYDTFELYISGDSFQLTVKSGNIIIDYTGNISSSQLKLLKNIY